MRIVFLILLIGFVGLAAAFALQNFQSTTVVFAGLQLTAPLAILIMLVYLFGMATGGGLFSFLRYSIYKATAPDQRRTRPIKPEPEPKTIDHAP